MNSKIENLKEKLKQALSSTARVISDDLDISSKKIKKKTQINSIILSWII